ncbi:HNH endonuclease signature motif containing protein [Brachybacterium hainanense]|uniref:HNH endonuclease signature motif containing protein n=1 Tax=Brachybacterium hainanense TaxID=1541174 RepID=A0ABV6R6I6_9MICO
MIVHVTPDVLTHEAPVPGQEAVAGEAPQSVPAGTSSAAPAAAPIATPTAEPVMPSILTPAAVPGVAREGIAGGSGAPVSLDPAQHRDRCGIEGAGPIEPTTVQRLTCTGRIAALVTDGDGEVLRLGRMRRLASPAQRRALRAVQKTCQYPGCHQSRHLDVHHLTPWSDGGLTDVEDLVLLCRRHHVMVHEGGLRLHRRASDEHGSAGSPGPEEDRALDRGSAPTEGPPHVGREPTRARISLAAAAQRMAGSVFDVQDPSGRPVQASWPALMEHARISRSPVEHPLRIVDAEPVPLYWGEGDVRIGATTAGYGFDRARTVDALVAARTPASQVEVRASSGPGKSMAGADRSAGRRIPAGQAPG